ncbi:uncharacterized protein [Cicer arietinum]|uniref:Transcription factor TCP2-like n=1 Tax=Cicer arietinum TaxID=3827 RepID=A0A1S2YHC4_CICAR|nr:transcription factor TCP2-like [Cicer arietinum]XP_004504555.1 transcription factor TCP2-like [Cicer arietinum]XP_004504556.1 transcription factor TCP2-like [Cicer arietinum]XP_027191536.1 transcription factor TCP2-like [Cicer arietinum]XP_027191537.1 transcription factor TCP2-like [Cicer arietinum]
MEEDEIQVQSQNQSCKFPRVGNNRNDQEEDLEDGSMRRVGGCDGNTNRLNNWHHSSRIIRVSRASGGKDRHSKVMTSKGLRDRRVRLSVTTAIQFYDLQDRLGYDQPSKAVEWLIKSASDAISELPSLNNTFPNDDDTNQLLQPSSEQQQGLDSADAEMIENGENNNYHQNQNNQNNLCLSKSGCSSTSETSKGSGLSLSRCDIRVSRVKARARARERTAKEKEKENNECSHHHQQQQQHQISQTASFTELLTGGINNAVANSPRGSSIDEADLFNKARQQQWNSAAPMDHYFNSVLLGPSSSSSSRTHHQSLSQIQLGHSLHEQHHQSMSFSNNSGENQNHQMQQQQQQHQFSFIPDNNDYNLNFKISSSLGLAGYNRGTLQSNSLSHLQRFSVSPIDHGSNVVVPFFMGGGGGGGASSATTASPSPSDATPTMENNHQIHHHHHQFSSVFDGSRLQLYSDHKGKPKN